MNGTMNGSQIPTSTILVGYDSSDCARRALTEAVRLQRLGLADELVVMSVFDPHKSDDPALNVAARIAGVVFAGSRETYQEIEEGLERALLSASAGGEMPPHRCVVLTGKPSDQIVAEAKRRGADMIVLGTRGLSSVASTVMGSVSTSVVHDTDVPVLLVK